MLFEQVKWENGHLKIYFPKHKSDQIGLNQKEAGHVYSNPNDPSVCWLHALASYLLVFSSIFNDGNKLFPGKDQKKRFNTCLHRVTKSNSHLYETKNVDPKEFGLHLIRKGAVTYCCDGVHFGPPICFRAGWTVCRVKEWYLKYENTGDEFIGCT